MTDFHTFKTGEILSNDERAKLSPEDRKRYDLEQKIRGLMKKADDPRTPDEERDTATRMISKLITKHQIDLALLREAKGSASGPVKIVKFSVSLSNKFGLGGVRCRALHRAVVVPLGGHSLFYHSASQSTRVDATLEIYMPEDVVDFARMLIASLTLQVETSMKVASVRHRRELQMNWVSKSEEAKLLDRFRKGYLLAWGSTVGARVSQGREDARQEVSRETGKEIALLDTTALAKKAMEDAHPKTRSARAVLVSSTGKQAGARDGMRTQLGINEVGGDRRARITA
jgi:hypothetical protein